MPTPAARASIIRKSIHQRGPEGRRRPPRPTHNKRTPPGAVERNSSNTRDRRQENVNLVPPGQLRPQEASDHRLRLRKARRACINTRPAPAAVASIERCTRRMAMPCSARHYLSTERSGLSACECVLPAPMPRSRRASSMATRSASRPPWGGYHSFLVQTNRFWVAACSADGPRQHAQHVLNTGKREPADSRAARGVSRRLVATGRTSVTRRSIRQQR